MDKFLRLREPELICRNPVTKTPLSPKGEWVDWDGASGRYWRRRVRDGDCYISEPDKPEKVIKTTFKKDKK